MLDLVLTGKFKKDMKLAQKRGLDLSLIKTVIDKLASQEPLEASYRDHPLTDCKEYINCRECHIKPDWLLIYRINEGRLILELLRTGTHADLFG